MEIEKGSIKKRKSTEGEKQRCKRSKESNDDTNHAEEHRAGKIQKILMRNFMCHDALEIVLNPNVNFIVGRNGSGKSAILTALTVGLGARANVTSRGTSIAGFIKKGKQSATIEVSLSNKGPMAYKPDVYGDSITVFRNIKATSSYKIKNWKGEVISTKRSELDEILRAMHIQIDNPISILNQDVSRTFLVASKPEEKYLLFMKATNLDEIGNNYKEAELLCQEEYQKFQLYNEILAEARKRVEKLEEDIKRAEEIDQFRTELTALETELCWAVAISEETKLQERRETLKKCEDGVKEHENAESFVESKKEEINKKIRELEDKIQSLEREVSENSEAYNIAKLEYAKNKNEYDKKSREWGSIKNTMRNVKEDMNMIRTEINKLENGDNTEQNEMKRLKEQLLNTEQKLENVMANLSTNQTYQAHLETDQFRLLKESQDANIEVNNCEDRILKIKRKLGALRQQSGNKLTVFGHNIPRLLRRIDEEYSNGRFKKKPRGPLGAYIQMKDPAWTAAVESYLGAETFSTFCVDNSHDAKVLNAIIKEICLNERAPQIICSKFHDKVHDVRHHCTGSSKYYNLLDSMVISDPVVSNCLIDQREVECVLMIPTSAEASALLSDQSRVPRNCKRAITQKGDTFYPDPNYRSYGGRRGLTAKFLHVSPLDLIKTLEEELRAAEQVKAAAMQSYATIREKEKRTSSELIATNAKVADLRAAHNKYKNLISDLKDKIAPSDTMCLNAYREELVELEKKLQQSQVEETRLSEAVTKLNVKIQSLEAEIKHHRELRLNLDTKINPLREHISQLQDEKEQINAKSEYSSRRFYIMRQALQNATAELEMQQRVTDKAVSDATNKCARIDTKKSAAEIKRQTTELKGKIHSIEQRFGTIEDLRKELKEKQEKCGKDLEVASKIRKSYEVQLERLKNRKILFENMKYKNGVNIQIAFTNILSLRQKKGTITIDHARKTLELEVSAQNESKRPCNDTRSLSGGERSYSTVAFILALWECTMLPFYFLDEFDVFMDKVNRRVVMDILLDHTKKHPQCQFTFLTPLSTSNILAEDYVTIHQLAPPERSGHSNI